MLADIFMRLSKLDIGAIPEGILEALSDCYLEDEYCKQSADCFVISKQEYETISNELRMRPGRMEQRQ